MNDADTLPHRRVRSIPATMRELMKSINYMGALNTLLQAEYMSMCRVQRNPDDELPLWIGTRPIIRLKPLRRKYSVLIEGERVWSWDEQVGSLPDYRDYANRCDLSIEITIVHLAEQEQLLANWRAKQLART